MQLTMTLTRTQRPIALVVSTALLIVALAAAVLYIGSQQTESPFRNGAVVWAVDGDLFIADRLGGTPRTLVAGPEEDSDPVFSDQGDRIAFVRDSSDGRRIMTVRSDGTGLTLLASGLPSFEVRLGWAPDGRALLASGEGRKDRRIYEFGPTSRVLDLIASDGSGSRRVDAGPDFAVGPGAWRPDGRHIAFLAISTPEEDVAAFIADADGTNVRRLPIEIAPDGGLAWSPDGTQLSFMSLPGGSVDQVHVADIDVDGGVTGLRPLFPDKAWVAPPLAWSPDGRYLTFLEWRRGWYTVVIVEPDGSGHRRVGPAATDFTWSPDGRSLVITGKDDPGTQISRRLPKSWLVDVATGEQTELQTPVDSWQHLAP